MMSNEHYMYPQPQMEQNRHQVCKADGVLQNYASFMALNLQLTEIALCLVCNEVYNQLHYSVYF